ncbi:MAG TPA: ribokinase [Puia sp.]|jgi:ribokinase|nr:ribokinase [Puia sp.]
MKPYILVVGSSNTDMVVKTDRLPGPGETVLGGAFLMAAGGKGANQAVAAARLGAKVVFIAKVGEDIFGKQAVEAFNLEGIDTRYMATDADNPSGVALITVDARGENCIVVASGANGNLVREDLAVAAEKIKNAGLVLMQLEVPLATVEYVVEQAALYGVPVILNPAPACVLSVELLRQVTVLTPNQKEAEMLSGVEIVDKAAAERAAAVLAGKGVRTVIITMGAEGAVVLENGGFEWVAAPKVTAVDTTAAGDVFCGGLAVGLSEGRPMKDAVGFACAAAALSVTKMGAQTSAPRRGEVDQFRG